jgi:hypothetical protein
MTEEELIDLGFEKIDILDSDSQNGYDYYYYNKELCSGVLLHSTDNIDVIDNKWSLKSFDIPALNITERIHYEQFLEIMGNITC